jgi:cystathionine beta-lyase/cystathionine gamma-synthase
VACDDVYGGTYRLFTRVLERVGLRFSFVDATDVRNVERALEPRTRLVWLESPTNPLMKLVDIAAVAQLAHARGALVGVDNTFASPYCQRPLELGADVVHYSTTKYLGGHSDVIGGALVTADEALYNRLQFLQNAIGGVPGAFDAWLVLRGLKTLALRMRQHSANALEVGCFLEQHARVKGVHYPGLESHPQREVAVRQLRVGGGMLAFELAGGREAGGAFIDALAYTQRTASLGSVHTMVVHPPSTTHRQLDDAALAEAGIPAGLLRVSVGLEDLDDLIADFERGIAAARAASPVSSRSDAATAATV